MTLIKTLILCRDLIHSCPENEWREWRIGVRLYLFSNDCPLQRLWKMLECFQSLLDSFKYVLRIYSFHIHSSIRSSRVTLGIWWMFGVSTNLVVCIFSNPASGWDIVVSQFQLSPNLQVRVVTETRRIWKLNFSI